MYAWEPFTLHLLKYLPFKCSDAFKRIDILVLIMATFFFLFVICVCQIFLKFGFPQCVKIE